MADARRLYINPADKTKGYVLWSNGYIEPFGGAVPVPQKEADATNWASQEAPVWYQGVPAANPAVALSIIDWNAPSGYTLDKWGLIWPWGGVATMPGATSPATTGPDFLWGGNGGWPETSFGFIADFVMDPAGNGRGYMLDFAGRVYSLGTGVTVITSDWLFWDTWADTLVLDWASKRYWVGDLLGRVWGRNGGNNASVAGTTALSRLDGFGMRVAGMKLYDKSATPKGWTVDPLGRVWRVNTAVDAPGGPFNPFFPQAIHTDLEIVDDGTGANPLRLMVLNTNGGRSEFVISTAPQGWVTGPTGTLTTETRPYVLWSYRDAEGDAQALYEVAIITDGTYLTGAVNEVQRLTPSGTISGGTFRITFDSYQTADIAYNASAATIQAALEALPNIGAGNVVCAGGPMNTAFVSITFQAKMAGWNWPQVTVQSSLTGTAPVITPSTTTAGVGIDPAVATASFRTSGTDMQTFRVRPNVDLVNDTYRAFVRVTDSGGLVSGWRYSEFVVNVTALNTPTITPTVLGGVSGISLLVHATTGAGLPAGSKFLVQYHDSDWDGTTWLNVRGCDALVPNGSGDATGVDLDARFGVLRSYRAITYLYDSTTDSFRGSAWSSTVTATLTPRNIWTLSRTTTTDVTVVSVRPDLEPEWTVNGASFTAQGRKYPIVLTDGVPKAPTFDLEINALTNAVRTTVTAMLQAGEPLLLRSPFGDEWYIKVFPKWSRKFLRATPLVSELTSIRDAAILKASVVSVKRPRVGPTAGPLIEA